MNEIKRQIGLIRRVKYIRSQYQHLKLASWHYRYLLNFFKQHRVFIMALIILLIAQGLIEALLIIFSRDQLSNQQRLWLAPLFWQFLAVFLIIFFINSYFSIRQEKTLGVWLANSIRRRLFKAYIDRPLSKMDQETKADLIAKISYQLPLVSMGVTNSFFGFLRWLIYSGVAVLIAFWGGLNWLLVLGVILGLSVIVGISAYFVARRYISQEVTFYSQIIKQIDINTTEKYFLKNFNQEKTVLDQFDRLVDFDSFFRVRRDLWMKMGFKVVFAILLLLSVLTHFFSAEFFTWLKLGGPEMKFLFLFLMIYFSRALNEGLRVGLYSYPARLGIFLTILKTTSTLRRENSLAFASTINFYSRKVQLFEKGDYFRRFNLVFQKGGRYLFHSLRPSGKSALAKLIAGVEAYRPKAMKVKVDGQRLDYVTWQRFGQGICFFDPQVSSDKTLMEFILGEDKETTAFSRIETALETLAIHKEVTSLLTSNNNFNASAGPVLANKVSAFALFTLHCLINKPEFIIIDNAWLDLQYEEIIKILPVLDRELPHTTIIVFARADNNYFKYQHKYEMGPKFKENS
jgi:ABC-type multidrug transport system fused ATPase/permease subunit